MCGFGGELRRDGVPDRGALERMAASMASRGPDGHGLWMHAGAGLVHRRLSVIDLTDTGAQPMSDPGLGMTVAFNGCIYNHRELREELQRLGHRFRGHSDTEVILRGWGEWGEALLPRLMGMFAFALVEHVGGRTVLVRDRLGIKPLYVAEPEPGVIRFASTLPALLAAGGLSGAVDPVALHHYLSLHSIVPAPRTILRDVGKLPPATIRTVEADGRSHDRVWWDPPFTRDEASAELSSADWQDALLEALRVAVRRRMVSDVPVAVLLSGGLDSSLIVALLAEEGQRGLATFSVGFPDAGGREGNEFAFSDMVAAEFATEHHQISVPGDRMLGALDGAIGAMSEPMVSHDTVAFWLLSQEVSRHVKVVQSGQGADEVLAGYYWYPPMMDAAGTGVGTYADAFFDRDDADVRALAPGAATGDPTRRFVTDHFTHAGAESPIDRALRIDTEIMLVDDPVKRVDNMTMAHGLEARVPFLDHELVELAARMPAELKVADGGKGVLKRAARGIVPDAVIDRPKGFFPVPALSHLEEPVVGMVREALHAPAARDRGLFDPAQVERMLGDPNADRTNLDGSTLWQIGLLELWLQRHVA